MQEIKLHLFEENYLFFVSTYKIFYSHVKNVLQY